MGNIANHSKQNTLYNEDWLSALKELCSAGLPLSAIPNTLAQMGFQPIDARTVKKYIQRGLIPGVTPEQYALARQARLKANNHQYTSRKTPKVWLAAVSRLMSDGWTVGMISKELARRGLKPSSTYTITQKLDNGEIPGHTRESYEAAKQARKARLFAQWCDVVRPMLLSGLPISAIESRLYAEKQCYASETSIRHFLQTGQIEGVTYAQYRDAVLRRQTAGKDPDD